MTGKIERDDETQLRFSPPDIVLLNVSFERVDGPQPDKARLSVDGVLRVQKVDGDMLTAVIDLEAGHEPPSFFNFRSKWKVAAEIIRGPINRDHVVEQSELLTYPVFLKATMLLGELSRELYPDGIPFLIPPARWKGKKDTIKVVWDVEDLPD